MKKSSLLLLAVSTAMMWSACGNDPIVPPTNEAELITSIKLTFTDSLGVEPVKTAQFRDLDGDGGNAPVQFDTIRLSPNRSYYVNIILLDESKTPVDTISNEVLEEANDHHFFFHFTGNSNVQVRYLDQDTNTPPLPIGLQTLWRTGAAGFGTSQIILKHQPGVKDGTETPGETDVDLSFLTFLQ